MWEGLRSVRDSFGADLGIQYKATTALLELGGIALLGERIAVDTQTNRRFRLRASGTLTHEQVLALNLQHHGDRSGFAVQDAYRELDDALFQIDIRMSTQRELTEVDDQGNVIP